MTNFEKIKFLLEMGVYKGVEVIITTPTGNVIYIFVRSSGDILRDDRNIPHNEVIINRHNITSITPIPNPPKLLPVGTKVRVFEEYRKGLDGVYTTAYKIDTLGIYSILDNEGNHISELPARAVYPVWED